jgi:hypothetical protein
MKLSASHPGHFIPGISTLLPTEYKDWSVAEYVPIDTPRTMHNSSNPAPSYNTIQGWDPIHIKEKYMSDYQI